MLAGEQMRWSARCMAAMFGGPGVFYAWLSFFEPREAITAIIYLVIATALILSVEEAAGRPDVGGVLQRCAARVRATRRRRP
jgi:hypothetical protein